MMQQFAKWLRERYTQFTGSIAFLPGVIALLFFAFSVTIVFIDASQWGKEVKSRLHWLSLRDATTARSIISAVITGIISLSVFSFSMVMIVLNQTASNLSNRTLDKLIGNRLQQTVLGCYIGSIVYALFLLSTIRNVAEGVYVPALSTYFLIALTIFDIFLFIYFLHYITQSVKYETIISRVARETKTSLAKTCTEQRKNCPKFRTAALSCRQQHQAYCSGYNCKNLFLFAGKTGGAQAYYILWAPTCSKAPVISSLQVPVLRKRRPNGCIPCTILCT